MEAESMVHALKQIHALLEPGGYLIDIHPSGEPAEFIYPVDGKEQFIGYLQETDDYIEYRQADEAIQTVITEGLFRAEKMNEFDFRSYAESFNELKVYLEENWSDAVIPDEVISNTEGFSRKHGKSKIILHEKIKIGLLKSI